MFTREHLHMIRQALQSPSVVANYGSVERFLSLKVELEKQISEADAAANLKAAAQGAPLRAVPDHT